MENGYLELFTEPTIPNVLKTKDYEIVVTTAKDSYAGTDESINLIIHGRLGSTKIILLDGGFNSGQKRNFRVSAQDVGQIVSISLGFRSVLFHDI